MFYYIFYNSNLNLNIIIENDNSFSSPQRPNSVNLKLQPLELKENELKAQKLTTPGKTFFLTLRYYCLTFYSRTRFIGLVQGNDEKLFRCEDHEFDN